MQAIVAARPWRVGLALVALISLLNSVAALPAGRPNFPRDPEMPAAWQHFFDWLSSPLVIFLSSVLLIPLLYVFATGVTYVLSRLLRGQGSFRALIATQAFAGVPLLLLAPVTLLLNLLHIPLLGGLFGLIIYVWVTCLEAIGLHEGMRLSLKRAWAIVLLPYTPLVLASCALVGFWFTATPTRVDNPALYADRPTQQVNTAAPRPSAPTPLPFPTRLPLPTPIPPAIVGHPLNNLAVSDVTSVAWSADGHLLAIGSWFGSVQLWDPAGQLRATLETGVIPSGQELGAVTAIAWSPDGRTIAVGGTSGNLQLWSRDGTLIRTLPHPGTISAVAWSPDTTRLAVSFTDDSLHSTVGSVVRLWDAAGVPVATLVGHTAGITSVAWSPNGVQLASGSHDRTVRLWDTEGHPRAVLAHDGEHVLAVSWSPDSATLATGADGGIRLWSAAGILNATLRDPTSLGDRGVTALAWSPSGNALAAADTERTIRVWHADGHLLGLLPDHPARIEAIGWSPTGNVLAVGYAMLGDATWLWQLDSNLR